MIFTYLALIFPFEVILTQGGSNLEAGEKLLLHMEYHELQNSHLS